MSEGFISRGFGGRRRRQDAALPPGQYLVDLRGTRYLATLFD